MFDFIPGNWTDREVIKTQYRCSWQGHHNGRMDSDNELAIIFYSIQTHGLSKETLSHERFVLINIGTTDGRAFQAAGNGLC